MEISKLSFLLLEEFVRQGGKQSPTAREIRTIAERLNQEGVEFGEISIAAAVIGWNAARGN